MKIELNKQLDRQVYLDFHEASVGGVDFGKKILRNHPNINVGNYNKYIDDCYEINKKELTAVLKDTTQCLKDVRLPLFDELQRYFTRDFSKENYTCCLSIFDCNPRYLETKTFQVFYKRPYNLRKEVIAHELTHFAFYDFCFDLGLKESKELWELSEIFNVIFLNLPKIQKAIGAEELLFYPALKDKLEVIKKIFAENPKAEDFIQKGVAYLSQG